MDFDLPKLIRMFSSGEKDRAHEGIKSGLRRLVDGSEDPELRLHFRMIELDGFDNFEYWNNVGYVCARTGNFLNAGYAYYESLGFGDSDKGRAYLGLAISLHQAGSYEASRSVSLKGLQHAIFAYTNEMISGDELIIFRAEEIVDALSISQDFLDDEDAEFVSDDEIKVLSRHLDGSYCDEFDAKISPTDMIEGFFRINKRSDRDYLVGILDNLMFMYRKSLFDEESEEEMVRPLWDW